MNVTELIERVERMPDDELAYAVLQSPHHNHEGGFTIAALRTLITQRNELLTACKSAIEVLARHGTEGYASDEGINILTQAIQKAENE